MSTSGSTKHWRQGPTHENIPRREQRDLLRDEQLGFQTDTAPRCSWTALLKRTTVDSSRHTAAALPDVAIVLGLVRVKGQANFVELQVLPGENHIFVSPLSKSCKRPSTLSHVLQAGWCCPVLFGLRVNDLPTACSHVEPAQYADCTALLATSPNIASRPLSDGFPS